MANGGRKQRRTGAQKRTRALRMVAIGALVLIGFLYYKPVRTYMETRAELTARAGEVRALERERDRLERRLASVGESQTLLRDARRLGLVLPGERLVIVKGISAWRRAHTAHRGARER